MAAITAIVTDEGLTNLLTTFNTSNTFLFLKRFEISNTAGVLDSTRTIGTINPSWVNLPISGRDDSFPTHITVRCTVPPNTVLSNQQVEEVYIIGEVNGGAEFLFAVGQLSVVYDFQGTLSLRIKIPIIDKNLNAIQFNYTQATEVSDHNVDPNAHTDLINATSKAGIPIQLSNHKYIGQHYDEKPVFDATVTQDMAVYKANDGKYYPAISDGTIKSKIAGYALLTEGIVVVSGFIKDTNITAPNSTDLYLSDTTPGLITGNTTLVKVGLSHGSGLFGFSALGVGGSGGSGSVDLSIESDFYSDFLNDSIFLRSTYDDFEDESLIDATPTTMSFDALNHRYDFTAGQVLQSVNLFDPLSTLVAIDKISLWVEHTDSGTPTIEISVDGGANFEAITPGNVFIPSFVGVDIRIRFTASGIGVVKHWGVLYERDLSAIASSLSVNKIMPIYYEGSLIDELDIINNFKFTGTASVVRADISFRVAPTGADCQFTLLKNNVEVGDLIPVTSGNKNGTHTLSSSIQFLNTDNLGLRVKQIGATEAGQGVNIYLHYIDD